MVSADTIITLGLTSVLLSLAPGPDNIFVLTQSALYGRRSGIFITLGLCTGLLFHTTAVAFGVAAIFQTSAWAFTALKLSGAAYLLYLAWQAFRAPVERIDDQPRMVTVSAGKLYQRGIIMNITNPKVSIFFLAFLPQFASPEAGPVATQIAIFGLIFMLSALVVFSLIAALAAMLGGWLSRSDKAQQHLNRIAGLVFVGLALKLATSEASL